MRTSPRAESRQQVPTGEVDPEVLEMEGFEELGDHSAALGVARRVLSRSRLAGRAFSRAVCSMLAIVDDLNDWRPLIERAWERLSRSAKREGRALMLGYR